MIFFSLIKIYSELQLRGKRDNSGKLFISQSNTCRDPSLALSQQDGSNEGSQCLYVWKNKETNP